MILEISNTFSRSIFCRDIQLQFIDTSTFGCIYIVNGPASIYIVESQPLTLSSPNTRDELSPYGQPGTLNHPILINDEKSNLHIVNYRVTSFCQDVEKVLTRANNADRTRAGYFSRVRERRGIKLQLRKQLTRSGWN